MRSLQPGGDEFLYLVKQAFPKSPLPAFVMGTLEDAIHEATVKQRPLLIYIHDLVSKKKVSENFLKNTLANKEALKLLASNYIVFGVDASTDEGKRTMKMLSVTNVPIVIIKIAINDMIPHVLNTIVPIISNQ